MTCEARASYTWTEVVSDLALLIPESDEIIDISYLNWLVKFVHSLLNWSYIYLFCVNSYFDADSLVVFLWQMLPSTELNRSLGKSSVLISCSVRLSL